MQVIDNALSKSDFNKIKSVFLSNLFPWFFNEEVAFEGDRNDDYYFIHMLYDYCKPFSNHYDLILPVLDILKPKSLIRIKANMYSNINKFVEHSSHTDFDYEHKGAILYLNTNNGYTRVGDDKIESKENRLLIFDASKPHNSTNCTDTKTRVNINFNYF